MSRFTNREATNRNKFGYKICVQIQNPCPNSNLNSNWIRFYQKFGRFRSFLTKFVHLRSNSSIFGHIWLNLSIFNLFLINELTCRWLFSFFKTKTDQKWTNFIKNISKIAIFWTRRWIEIQFRRHCRRFNDDSNSDDKFVFQLKPDFD